VRKSITPLMAANAFERVVRAFAKIAADLLSKQRLPLMASARRVHEWSRQMQHHCYAASRTSVHEACGPTQNAMVLKRIRGLR